jgi:hypothetical protein
MNTKATHALSKTRQSSCLLPRHFVTNSITPPVRVLIGRFAAAGNETNAICPEEDATQSNRIVACKQRIQTTNKIFYFTPHIKLIYERALHQFMHLMLPPNLSHKYLLRQFRLTNH